MALERWGILVVAMAGCSVDDEGAVKADTDQEADADTDTDADSDADTDADADAAIGASGTWIGDCGALVDTTTTTSEYLGFHLQLELTDTGGTLDGTVQMAKFYDASESFPYGVVGVSGSRDGSDVVVHLEDELLGDVFVFELTLAGDVMDGALVLFQDPYGELALPCTLVR
jgi:hypothetical protein